MFTPVAQGAARRMSFHVFSHVLDLDVGFHLDRRTGVLSRVLERGMGVLFAGGGCVGCWTMHQLHHNHQHIPNTQ